MPQRSSLSPGRMPISLGNGYDSSPSESETRRLPGLLSSGLSSKSVGEPDNSDFEILSARLVNITGVFAGEMGPFYEKADPVWHDNMAGSVALPVRHSPFEPRSLSVSVERCTSAK